MCLNPEQLPELGNPGPLRGERRSVEGSCAPALLYPSADLPQAVYNSSIREGKINVYQHKLKPKKGTVRVKAESVSTRLVGIQVAACAQGTEWSNWASRSRGAMGTLSEQACLSCSVIRREHGDPLIEELNPGDALEPEGRGTGEAP